MKFLLAFSICIVLHFELSNGFYLQSLKYRVRRDAKNAENIDPVLEKVRENAQKELVELGKNAVSSFTDIFGKILEQAKIDDIQGENIENIKKTTQEGIELLGKSIEDDESIEKLFDLFGKVIDIADQFTELENPTDEQKSIKKILDDSNGELIATNIINDFKKLRSNLDENVSKYLESATETVKDNQKDLLDWFNKFKKASGMDSLIDTTMSFFGLFDDDEE